MRVSTITAPELRFGMIGAMRMILEAGFDALDLTMSVPSALFCDDPAPLMQEMRRTAQAYGAVFNQAHAPFPSFKSGDTCQVRAYNEEMPKKVEHAIAVAGELGAQRIVIHPIWLPDATSDEMLAFNLEHIGQFLPHARRAGVKIALENMWGHHKDAPTRIVPNVCSFGEELLRFVKAFDDPFVVPLADLGHFGLVGARADREIRAIGHALDGLHVHDNDFYRDTHTLPFLEKIDFEAVIDALIDIEYRGDVTFEVEGSYLDRFPDALVPDALRLQYKVGAYMRDRILAGIRERAAAKAR